jgi:hypothetical protein
MEVRTKSIEQLKEEFEHEDSGDRLVFTDFYLCIPNAMFHIMGKTIEVERDMILSGLESAEGYFYRNKNDTWRLYEEWVKPIDNEIDDLFGNMLEDL